jgi:hypothetical protein
MPFCASDHAERMGDDRGSLLSAHPPNRPRPLQAPNVDGHSRHPVSTRIDPRGDHEADRATRPVVPSIFQRHRTRLKPAA